MPRVALVTGVSRHLGGLVARELSLRAEFDRVIGVDVVEPEVELGEAEFIKADIRNPIVAKALRGVDTVVHMGVIATPEAAGGRSVMKEINVIGTMQLLAACQRSESISRVIVKSSASVYGAGPKDPAMFTETMDPRHVPTSGWAKDNVEVETYVRGFSRRRPDVGVTTLRFANIIGPEIRTGITDYFSMPLVPTILGHDARMQFVHETDSVNAVVHASVGDVKGTFNVAGDGVLMLSQAIRRAGRPNLPVIASLMPVAGRVAKQLGLVDFSTEQVRFLTWGRALDTTRMRDVLGFEPQYTTVEAFDSFIEANDLHALLTPDRAAVIEAQVIDLFSKAGDGRG